MGVSKENIGESGCGQRESQTVQLTELEKRDRHPTFAGLISNTFTMLWMGCTLSKNGVDLVKVSIFCTNRRKRSG